MLTSSHDIYRDKNKIVPYYTHYKSKNLLSSKLCLLTLATDILINPSINGFIFITYATQNSVEFFTAKFDRNWAYAHARGSSTNGVGWSSASFPSFGYSFKCKSRWSSLPHAKITNSTMMCSASIIFSSLECTCTSIYFSLLS